MKVLLVDLETAWRGGQNQALLILKGLRAHGHKAELVAAKRSVLGERARESGVTVHFVSRELFRIPAAWKVRELIASGRFDLVHANEAHAVSAVWLAGAHKRVPYLISRRVGYPIGKSRSSRARYEGAAKIVAISKWVADRVLASGIQREKVTVVYEGVEIPPQLTEEQRKAARARWNVTPGTPLLGCVGALLPDKGQEWLIRALAQLRKEYPRCKLLLAGEGPNRPTLERLAAELGLRDEVIFAGFVREIDTVYSALDVFLFPSFFEGLGTSLLAAMSHGVPSIAFNRCAFGEIIEHGKNGLLVSGPDVSEICCAVMKILRDADYAAKLGDEGRKRVEETFSAEQMVNGIVRVYQEVLAARG